MDILKKSLAPVTDKAWKEITEQTKNLLNACLTARNFVDIDGPNGLEFGGVSTGRLVIPENQSPEGINFGIREFLPMVEVRKPFELDLWELDNIERGARDINLEPLITAVKEIAGFEEKAIYESFEPVQIKGLAQATVNKPVTIPTETNTFLKEVGNQIINLSRKAVEGPYTMVISEQEWLEIVNLSEGYPVQVQLKEILGGKVIINSSNQKTFLVSERGGDYELVLGQDISIGYDSHTTKSVKLFLTSSFTFRVLTPEAVVVFNNSSNE
jgi:uncharacterized linocin/CFP29 family protein